MTSETGMKTRVFLILCWLVLYGLQISILTKTSYKSEITTEEIEKLNYEIVANSTRKKISQACLAFFNLLFSFLERKNYAKIYQHNYRGT